MKDFLGAYKDFVKAIELDSDVENRYYDKIPSLMKIFIKTDKTSNMPVGLCRIRK